MTGTSLPVQRPGLSRSSNVERLLSLTVMSWPHPPCLSHAGLFFPFTSSYSEGTFCLSAQGLVKFKKQCFYATVRFDKNMKQPIYYFPFLSLSHLLIQIHKPAVFLLKRFSE